MAQHNTLDVCRVDLFTTREVLEERYPLVIVAAVLRIRDEYNWFLSNPDAKDRQFVEQAVSRHGISRMQAYNDLAVVKALLPNLAQASRDFHRYRFNEMILETYQMAKKRKDTKTMEKAASSYAKNNRVDLEDEQTIPYELIIVQPFTATGDPTVLGIKPMPHLKQRIHAMKKLYSEDNLDMEDVQFEEADLEENTLFPEEKQDGTTEERNIL